MSWMKSYMLNTHAREVFLTMQKILAMKQEFFIETENILSVNVYRGKRE